jgi:glucose uptake protein
MAPAAIAWLSAAAATFLAASTALRAYAGSDWLPMLLAALVLYTAGNLMMVPLMRASGMAVAISVAAVLQLVLANGVAVLAFGERPGPYQSAGILLGIVSVALILWAPGAREG